MFHIGRNLAVLVAGCTRVMGLHKERVTDHTRIPPKYMMGAVRCCLDCDGLYLSVALSRVSRALICATLFVARMLFMFIHASRLQTENDLFLTFAMSSSILHRHMVLCNCCVYCAVLAAALYSEAKIHSLMSIGHLLPSWSRGPM